MIDVDRIFSRLVQAVRGENYPDAETIAALLNLDTSAARISKTGRGNLAITGARAEEGTVEVDAIGTVAPRKLLNLSLPNSQIPYESVGQQTFGANQRLQPSKFSNGLAILFERDGLNCGFTASAPDGVVNSLFCEEPRPARSDPGS